MEKTLAFLGTGSMNGSILSGLLQEGYPASLVSATVRSAESATKLAEKVDGAGIQILTTSKDQDANKQAVAGAELVLLGVKPYDILALAREVAPVLKKDAVVVSVAAGVSLDSLQKALPQGQPVVRCMPNTPSRVGKGVLAISAAACSEEQIEAVEKVLAAVGLVVRVEEDQMDAVTAVSGSGPAYAFLLAETMAEAGVKLGLDAETAQKLVAATLSGAGALLEKDPQPAELRRAVTSPGGTTEQAIKTYQEGGLAELTEQAMRACAEKSAQMTQEYAD